MPYAGPIVRAAYHARKKMLDGRVMAWWSWLILGAGGGAFLLYLYVVVALILGRL